MPASYEQCARFSSIEYGLALLDVTVMWLVSGGDIAMHLDKSHLVRCAAQRNRADHCGLRSV